MPNKPTSTELLLREIYPITNPEDYKLHLACRCEDTEPLDLLVDDWNEWEEWNTYKSRNEFNRPFIFALVEFYPEEHRWLFGGTWQIHGTRRYRDKYWAYDASLVQECKPFIGRLKINLKRPARPKALCFEAHYSKLVVSEILPTPYAGEVFCGLDDIDIEFNNLAGIMERQPLDWKSRLEDVQGVYLITDTRTGKRYVGSAYGQGGIWSRWQDYIETGHGGNTDLKKLISKRRLDYARKHFRFALLEHFSMKTDVERITERETYWKRVLCSRGKYGHNRN